MKRLKAIKLIGLLFTLPSVVLKGKDIKAYDWIMYPNPAKDYFIIRTNGELAPYVKIYNMGGVLMQEEFIGPGRNIVTIHIHLKPGEYIVYLDKKNAYA